MKTLQRYFSVSILQAVAFVLAAFLGLASFLDMTGELPNIGNAGYDLRHALLYVLLCLPSHVYDLMPVAALIGTIYTMAKFANSSEFTIMRASGMSTRMAAWMLFKVGLILVGITFLFGELIAPRTAPLAERIKLTARGATVAQGLASGMWTKDVVRTGGTSGAVTGSRFFNVRKFQIDGQLLDIRLYEFDTTLHLTKLITAERASFKGNNTWRLESVTETVFANTATLNGPGPAAATFGQESSTVSTRQLPGIDLISDITPTIISISASDPDRMAAAELAALTRHLSENKQENQRYKIAFWKKLVDPLAVLVLMAMALPFAYLQSRSGGVSIKIFSGIMIGLAYMLVNGLVGHVGLLSSTPAVVTAVAPSLLFLGLALGALRRVEKAG